MNGLSRRLSGIRDPVISHDASVCGRLGCSTRSGEAAPSPSVGLQRCALRTRLCAQTREPRQAFVCGSAACRHVLQWELKLRNFSTAWPNKAYFFLCFRNPFILLIPVCLGKSFKTSTRKSYFHVHRTNNTTFIFSLLSCFKLEYQSHMLKE